MRDSKIEWTDNTWNPWIGCHKVSPGCQKCYAERIDTKFGHNFDIVRPTKQMHAPYAWNKPSLIFTCSMSDFFLPEADVWRAEAWKVIKNTPQHTYQILTKRPHLIRERLPDDWGPMNGPGYSNVWLGTSVEMAMYWSRVEILRTIPARNHFVSAEPLLGPLGNVDLADIEWVISGGESDDTNPRPMNPEWALDLLRVCHRQNVAFFHKQNGGRKRCECHGAWGCRLLDGQTYSEYPG